MVEARYTIKAVSRLTGLSPHVIRVWEKRYGAVRPSRTGTNRRLYSEEEAQRLRLLRRATQAGHSIGSVANLANEKLEQLGAGGFAEPSILTTSGVEEKPQEEHPDYVWRCVQAIKKLDTSGFEEVLSQAIVALGQHGLLERVIGPLAREIGELWRDGTIMAAHEHFASAVIRTFLGRNSRPFSSSQETATLVVGTPSGQLHEIGALMVGAAANDVGWRVVYLGASLPAADIAGAAVKNQARAVALSIVYPADDPNLPNELENLRRYLPPAVRIIVGGRAAPAYGDALRIVGAAHAPELRDLYGILEGLREPASKQQANPT